jgi:hypothetical protein
MGCAVLVSGPIIDGNAEQLRHLIVNAGWDGWSVPVAGRICFDSPGGSFPEGLRMARVIQEVNGGTAVPENATCASACAIAFMAGSFQQGDADPLWDRWLHPGGSLGFHAPSLSLPSGGNYSDEDVASAYQIALETVAQLAEARITVVLDISDTLFLSWLRTPPDQMLWIETIQQAAEVGVLVGPVPLPNYELQEMLLMICRNSTARLSYDIVEASLLQFGQTEPSRVRCGATINEYFEFDIMLPDFDDFGTTGLISDWSEIVTYPFHFYRTTDALRAISHGTSISQDISADVLSLFVNTNDGDVHHSSQPMRLQYSSFWDHNGSRMGLIVDVERRRFHYAAPRAALAERGVSQGRLLFEGERIGNRYTGTARIFATTACGEFTYPVEGPVSADQRRVTMYGRAPRVNNRCEITGYRDDTLVFTLE